MCAFRAASKTGPIAPPKGGTYQPPPISHVDDTGLSFLWLQDLALKILYFQGYMNGFKVAEELALPFAGLADQILEALKREKFVVVKSIQKMGLGEGSYQYAITGAGIARAREALDRSQYAGPAPVPLSTYNEAIIRQSRGRTTIVNRVLRQSLSHMVLSENAFQRIGPAINSGTSIFMYGPPGNGKTKLAKAVAGESNAHIEIISGPEILSKWMGESEQKLREIFNRAKSFAPSVILMDELDSIAGRRNIQETSHLQSVVSQLLVLTNLSHLINP